jgi:hypothetical protein
MTNEVRWIEVRGVPNPPGYIHVDGGPTYSNGLHSLWNYDQLKHGPDFNKYVNEKKIIVKPPGWTPG